MADQSPEQKKGGNSKFIWIIALLILSVGVLTFFLNTKNNQVEDLEQVKEELEFDLKSLEEDLKDSKSSNDSLNVVIENERKRLHSMLDSVKELRNFDLSKIKEYKRQVFSYKKNNKKLLAQVDSLEEANRLLAEQKAAVEMDLMAEQERSSNLEGQNMDLQKEVAIGAVLQLTKMEGFALKVKSSGKESETTRASRTNRLKACFTIGKNLISEKGEKVIYMRITTPEKTILSGKKDAAQTKTFSFNGQDLLYSNSLSVYYEGEPLESCISYDKDSEFAKGDYLIELYTEGYKIGEAKVALD